MFTLFSTGSTALHNQDGQILCIVRRRRECACVLISITGWHGVSNSGRDCQCFPDMAPLARLKTRSVNRDGLERSRAGLAWAAVSTQ